MTECYFLSLASPQLLRILRFLVADLSAYHPTSSQYSGDSPVKPVEEGRSPGTPYTLTVATGLGRPVAVRGGHRLR